MDLSFSLKSAGRRLNHRLSMADIREAADKRRMDSADGVVDDSAGNGEGRQLSDDWVHILARRLGPHPCGEDETAILGGSFNPLVARQLMVGKE